MADERALSLRPLILVPALITLAVENAPAHERIDERALSRPAAANDADDEDAIEVQLQLGEARGDASPQCLCALKRRPLRQRFDPSAQSTQQPIVLGQLLLLAPVVFVKCGHD